MHLCLIVIGFFASVFLGSSVGGETPGRTFYVSSTAGNDRNPGTLTQPFLTIERARDVIRELKISGALRATAITVYLRRGLYPLTQTFILNDQDSGMPDARIMYAAYQQEEVRLSGSVKLQAESFQVVRT